jgi:hypothetical protein
LIGEAIVCDRVFLQGRRAAWRTLRLGVLTSLIGFSPCCSPALACSWAVAITGILTASV